MIEQKLTGILNAYLEDAAPVITPDTVLTTDLGLNSMELFDLVCAIEESFGVTIPDRALPKLLTVRDVVEYLETAAGMG